MKNEKFITNIFINYLKEHGYPEKSIAMQFSNDHGHHIDIAIIDKSTNVPIQLFEIKNEANISRTIMQINNYRRTLQNTDIPAYIVSSYDVQPFFKILKINSQKADPINDLTSELNYEAQRNARVSEEKRYVVTKREKTIDRFKIFSWILASLTFIIVLLEKSTIFNFQLNSIDLYFLLTIIALYLIPYFSKIKFWNIEIERLTHDDESKIK